MKAFEELRSRAKTESGDNNNNNNNNSNEEESVNWVLLLLSVSFVSHTSFIVQWNL